MARALVEQVPENVVVHGVELDDCGGIARARDCQGTKPHPERHRPPRHSLRDLIHAQTREAAVVVHQRGGVGTEDETSIGVREAGVWITSIAAVAAAAFTPQLPQPIRFLDHDAVNRPKVDRVAEMKSAIGDLHGIDVPDEETTTAPGGIAAPPTMDANQRGIREQRLTILEQEEFAARVGTRGADIGRGPRGGNRVQLVRDRKSTRLNSSHGYISYAVFCLKKKKTTTTCVHNTRYT